MFYFFKVYFLFSSVRELCNVLCHMINIYLSTGKQFVFLIYANTVKLQKIQENKKFPCV